MIEEIIYNWLKTKLEVPVFTEIPETMPETFVFLEKTGGGENEHICESTLAVQSYAPTRYGAALLNEQVKDAMRDAVTLKEISRVALNSDYPYRDTLRKKNRYQAVFYIVHY